MIEQHVQQGSRSGSAVLGVYIAASALFTGVYFRATLSDWEYKSRLLSSFTASTPFQYRVLQPLVAHAIHSVAPIDFGAINVALTYLVVLLMLYFFRKFLGLVGISRSQYARGLSPSVIDWAALAILIPLFWNYVIFGVYYYPSDMLSITLFIAGLNCILEQRFTTYYVVLTLASLNRETSCFLVLAYILLLFDHVPRSTLLRHSLLQCAICISIHALIVFLFRANPGVVFQHTFATNWIDLQRLVTGHALMFTVFVAGAFGGFHWLTIMAYPRLPDTLKRLLWIIPALCFGMIWVALLFEMRIYNELIPLVSASTVAWFIGKVKSEDSPSILCKTS